MNFLDQPVSVLMTSNPAVVDPAQRLSDARHRMLASGGHHIPVVQERRFVGLLAPSDLLRVTPSDGYAMDPDAFDKALADVSVRHAMQEDVITIGPDVAVRAACALFASGGFHCLPVVDVDGRLVGVLTTTDIIRALVKSEGRELGAAS
jgi:CBS domain-containing protein